MRRVVITGIGMVTPLSGQTMHSWERLKNGHSGIASVTQFDVSDFPTKIAGMVPCGIGPGLLDVDSVMEPAEQRKTDPFIIWGMAAAKQAVEDAGWMPTDEESLERTGVMIGCGIGGLTRIYDSSVTLVEKGFRRVSPYFIPASLINLVSGHVSIKYGFCGPNHSVVTACATGAHAIGDATRMIQLGDADVMLAGGSEAAVCRLGMAGFGSLRALSTNFNDTPEKASRPWDRDRDGFVMGEGSGIVVLEELEHAKKRGAKIYGEVVGYGMSGDAYHLTSPHPEGKGIMRAMRNALNSAKLNPDDIGYVNAHGTSTPPGDAIEFHGIKTVFASCSDKIAVSSTKSAIGHLLGAAGGVEAIFSLMALNEGILPPTLNLENPSDNCVGLNLVPQKAQEKTFDYAMSNSFGFGGTNASLILAKFKG